MHVQRVQVLKLCKEKSKLDFHFLKELGPAVSLLSSTWLFVLLYIQQTKWILITYTYDFNTVSGIRKK
jgi:hypothetical protein